MISQALSARTTVRIDPDDVLVRILDRKIAGIRAAQDAVDIGRDLRHFVDLIGTVEHETAAYEIFPLIVDRGQAVPGRRGDFLVQIRIDKSIGQLQKAAAGFARERLDCIEQLGLISRKPGDERSLE
jgi:hypothetical protein